MSATSICSVCGGNITGGTLCKGGIKVPFPKQSAFVNGQTVYVDGKSARFEKSWPLQEKGKYFYEVWLEGNDHTSAFWPHHVSEQPSTRT